MRSLLIGVLLAFVVGPALGQEYIATSVDRWKILRGLPGVEVVVEDMEPDAERDGLRKSVLQTAVELRLRSNGIKVLTQEDAIAATPRMAYLYVKVTAYKNSDGLYAFSPRVELKEVAFLHSNPPMLTPASTWQAFLVGTAGATYLRGVQDGVLELVDEFCNDFLRANPK